MSCQYHQSTWAVLQINVITRTSPQKYKILKSFAIADTHLTHAEKRKRMIPSSLSVFSSLALTQIWWRAESGRWREEGGRRKEEGGEWREEGEKG